MYDKTWSEITLSFNRFVLMVIMMMTRQAKNTGSIADLTETDSSYATYQIIKVQ